MTLVTFIVPKSIKSINGLKLTVVGSNQDIFSKLLGTDLSLQGNFPNEYLAAESIKDFKKHLTNFIRYVKDQDLANRAGWICSLDHGVLKTTPEEHVKLFIEKIEIYLDDLDMPWPTGKKPMHK